MPLPKKVLTTPTMLYRMKKDGLRPACAAGSESSSEVEHRLRQRNGRANNPAHTAFPR
jgi:hypothetical protein